MLSTCGFERRSSCFEDIAARASDGWVVERKSLVPQNVLEYRLTDLLDYWRPVVILLAQRMFGPSSEKLPTGANIPQLMARLNLAESSLAQTLVAFMEHAVSLTFVRQTPLARALEYVQTAAYNFLAILYHLLDEALWLLRSAADSVQLGPEEVPFRVLHVSILDRLFKSFRNRCKLLRNSLPDIGAAFSSGQAALATVLKAVGFHYISRMLPGGLGTHAALIDDLPAVFSVLKRSARDVVDASANGIVVCRGLVIPTTGQNIDSASLSVYSYDIQKHKHQFRNKITLQSALLRLHALCYNAATLQSPRPSLYSELANHVSELLKLYKNKVRPSHHARINYTERHVRHLLRLALIVADAHRLLAKNAQTLIDIVEGEAGQIIDDPTPAYHNFSVGLNDEMNHLMKCLNSVQPESTYSTQIALLSSRVGKYLNVVAALLTLTASVMNLVKNGSDATMNVISASLAFIAVLCMTVGKSPSC
ncbi:uncharacterized protein ARMOST_06308 [Armillaria ostoyae]|uniref:Uncharacterized protein n=1 Tax=Armillaria ostoyae TaxID=47428 RepID=A0A284R2Q9_ARMOS|nr:uncharacterized protein ARMOST_06308 [Armillaria ostoyae]